LTESATLGQYGKQIEVTDQFMAANLFTPELLQSSRRFLALHYANDGYTMPTRKLTLVRAARSRYQWPQIRYDFNPR